MSLVPKGKDKWIQGIAGKIFPQNSNVRTLA